jgi:hypothetical protein
LPEARKKTLGPGLEWLADGSCVHVPPARGREWLEAPIAEAPAGLVEVLERAGVFGARAVARGRYERNLRTSFPHGGGSGDVVAGVLAELDAVEFRDHDRWFRLMLAAKCGGIDREEFIAWSASDPQYADHADVVERRWDSVRADGNAEVLWREVRLAELRRERDHGCKPLRAYTASSSPSHGGERSAQVPLQGGQNEE